MLRKRINYQLSRIKHSLMGIRRLPSRLVIDTTTQCQLNCIGCYVNKERKVEEEFPSGLFEKTFEEIKNYIKLINFSLAGEPFLSKDIFKMIKLASFNHIQTLINSNGEMIGEVASDIIASGLTSLNIDLSGVNQEELTSYRAGSNFDNVVKNFKKVVQVRSQLKSQRPLLSLELLITKQTYHSIGDFIKLAKSIGANMAILKSLNLDFGKKLSDSQRLSLAEKYLPNDSRYCRYKIKNNKVEIRKEILQMPCPEVFENVTIFNDGSIGLCCADINKYYPYGDIYVESLRDLIFSNEFINLRKQALKRKLEICQKCSFPGSFLFNHFIKL